MDTFSNRLRPALLEGKAKEDFHKWYWMTYNNIADDVEYWDYHSQLEYFSKFFGKKNHNSSQFYDIMNEYNKSTA